MEAFGVVASVATLASEGLKLSNALHSYYQKVKNAEEDVKKVSRDVKSTAVVLRQLENILKHDARRNAPRLSMRAPHSSLREFADTSA